MESNLCKRIVLEYLSFLQYKVENDLLTMDEIESMAKMLEANLIVYGTIDNFAEFYSQQRSNVSAVIHRKLFAKPIRRVYYPFNAFQKIIPDRWRSQKMKVSQKTERMNTGDDYFL